MEGSSPIAPTFTLSELYTNKVLTLQLQKRELDQLREENKLLRNKLFECARYEQAYRQEQQRSAAVIDELRLAEAKIDSFRMTLQAVQRDLGTIDRVNANLAHFVDSGIHCMYASTHHEVVEEQDEKKRKLFQ